MLETEQETTITYDKAEKIVRIFTAWPKDQHKLEKAGIKPTDGTPEKGLFYSISLSQFKWRVQLVPRKRPISDMSHLHGGKKIPGAV